MVDESGRSFSSQIPWRRHVAHTVDVAVADAEVLADDAVIAGQVDNFDPISLC